MLTRIISSFGSIKVLGILIGIIALFTSAYLYGNKQYHKGYNEAKANYLIEINKLNSHINDIELSMLQKINKERELNAKNQEKANHIINTANANVRRLQLTISKLQKDKRNLSTNNHSSSTNSFSKGNTQCWVVLQESIDRYSEVARDADLLVERLREAKSWGNVIESELTSKGLRE